MAGYIHGDCSSAGMKKNYLTYIEETALLFDERILISSARGVQILRESGTAHWLYSGRAM